MSRCGTLTNVNSKVPAMSVVLHKKQINPFATGDAYMRQLFHCLQWYAGSERVKTKMIIWL